MVNEAEKCACKDCVCAVSAEKAVVKDDQRYCCEECAAGHAHHEGCNHNGCRCHG